MTDRSSWFLSALVSALVFTLQFTIFVLVFASPREWRGDLPLRFVGLGVVPLVAGLLRYPPSLVACVLAYVSAFSVVQALRGSLSSDDMTWWGIIIVMTYAGGVPMLMTFLVGLVLRPVALLLARLFLERR